MCWYDKHPEPEFANLLSTAAQESVPNLAESIPWLIEHLQIRALFELLIKGSGVMKK